MASGDEDGSVADLPFYIETINQAAVFTASLTALIGWAWIDSEGMLDQIFGFLIK